MKTALFLTICLSTLLVGCNPYVPPPAVQASNSQSHQVETAKPTAPVERWDISASQNELDKSKKITVSTYEVVVRCAPRLEAYVNPPLPQLGHMLETDGERAQRVRYRLDSQPIRSGTWAVADSFDALFMPASVARELGKHHQLVLEYSPEYTTTQTHTFDLEGLAEAENKAGCKIR